MAVGLTHIRLEGLLPASRLIGFRMGRLTTADCWTGTCSIAWVLAILGNLKIVPVDRKLRCACARIPVWRYDGLRQRHCLANWIGGFSNPYISAIRTVVLAVH
jgi:hypothetical protein